jgi:sugar O-acyltransferase (sialic acid O-acetyltransferase NeuD family)
MKDLILIGAGSFGREIYSWLGNCHGFNDQWRFKGFIDNDIKRLEKYGRSKEIIGLINEYQPQENDVFLCTIAEQKYRKQYTLFYETKNAQFVSIFHKSSYINQESKIGIGVFVSPFCIISCDVKIGNHVLFNSYADVGHDVIIDDYCHINSFSLLGGFSHICEGATVHPNSVVLPGKKVGKNSIVGAGSIVIKNVPSNVTVFGAPAKIISF